MRGPEPPEQAAGALRPVVRDSEGLSGKSVDYFVALFCAFIEIPQSEANRDAHVR